ncbi:MAG: methionyl-tRNA formyltransferase, partial [Anderseniella sp.]
MKKHAAIDWNKPVKQVYDLIRGTNPSPGAWTTLNGAEVQVFDCQRVPGDGVSSKVIAVDDEGVTVQLIGGRIKILRVRPDGSDKMSAKDWAVSAGVEPGSVLGS